MIKNERQYRITNAQVKKFKVELNQLNAKESELDPILFQAKKDAIKSQIEEMEKDLEEYEQLQQSKKPPIITLQYVDDISSNLIKARIALGLSQKELAKIVGVKEQQIQRWEATDYSTISIARIKEIIKALNIAFPKILQIPRERIDISKFLKKMEKVGLNQRFIVNRLLPPLLASYFEDNNKKITPDLITLQAATIIGKIFHWTPEDILGDTIPQFNNSIIPELRHKLPKRRNKLWMNAYTLYSHYIATIIAKATENIVQKPLLKDPYKIHRMILVQYGSLNLENLVRYVWELGVPIIALDDPGAFHAVCFRINNRSIIILKQKTLSEARWMFDLFHEFWHAAQKEENILELPSESNNISIEKEDITASQFAAALLLGKNPQNLAEMCMKESKRDARRIKQAIRTVAKKDNVRADVLAYYIAFRLYLEGDNSMWGIAENLQIKSKTEPRKTINNILFEYADLGKVSNPDLKLLSRALTYEGESIDG